MVADSNAILERLRAVAAGFPEPLAKLAELPRHLTGTVGEHRLGIARGDPESLAGWQLPLEAIEPTDKIAQARKGPVLEGN